MTTDASVDAVTPTGWERRQQQTRQDVLTAAGEIIAADGIDGLTMRRLASTAGVAVATLYNQFGDRDGVIVAYVSNGLDQLEVEFELQPPHEPVEATRALLRTLDETVDADVDVWRPIFSLLGAAPAAMYGLGEVGERLVQLIEHDLRRADADGMFIPGCDIDRMARHVFITRMNRLEKWATGAIDWAEYRASSDLGLEIVFAAVLADDDARLRALRAAAVLSSTSDS